jgi:hypothetical protein
MVIGPVKNFVASRSVLFLRLAGLVSVASGLIGGYVWAADLIDRSDGDDLRWGFWHNPFMQFPPWNESFLDISMWILFACSAAAGLGGLLLLRPLKWGVPLVTLQARVSIIINSVIVFFIVAMMLTVPMIQTSQSLLLRLGSVAVDLTLWTFLSSNAVREFFVRQSHRPGRAFEVIVEESRGVT